MRNTVQTPRIGYSQRAFAERWGLHPKTVGRWTRAGLLKPLRLGKCLRYTDAMLEQADLSRRAAEILKRVTQEAGERP